MRFLLISIISFVFSWSTIYGDAHESLAKRSVSGKPFYVNNQQLPIELYDTIFGVILEFTTPNWANPINLIGYTCTGDDYDNDG